MANFEPALALALKEEGGYVNDPEDAGGETFRGISRVYWPDWEGWFLVDGLKKDPAFPGIAVTDPILFAAVAQFYHEKFWRPNRYGEIRDQALANKVFSLALTNPRNAHIALQTACRWLGRDPGALDGRIGPQTLHAVNSCRGDTLLKAFKICMGAYYLRIENLTYIDGWLNRALA